MRQRLNSETSKCFECESRRRVYRPKDYGAVVIYTLDLDALDVRSAVRHSQRRRNTVFERSIPWVPQSFRRAKAYLSALGF